MLSPKVLVLLVLAALSFVGDCTPQPQVGHFPLPSLQIEDG